MAQIDMTLNQEEIQQMLSENIREAFRQILQISLNKILQAESAFVPAFKCRDATGILACNSLIDRL